MAFVRKEVQMSLYDVTIDRSSTIVIVEADSIEEAEIEAFIDYKANLRDDFESWVAESKLSDEEDPSYKLPKLGTI